MVHYSKLGISGSILIKICIWFTNPDLDPDYIKITQNKAQISSVFWPIRTLLDKPGCIVGGGHQPLCACFILITSNMLGKTLI